MYHLPVLCREAVEALLTRPNGVYADVTMGGAGHTSEILRHLGDKGHLYSFDRDRDAIANAPVDPRFTFVASDFRYLSRWMRYFGVEHLDGVLADLGVSSHHFDTAERGFSFRFEGALPDMRMNNRAGRTAADLLNTYSVEALSDLFYYYGELKDARRIAALIEKGRPSSGYRTIEFLLEILAPILPPQPPLRRKKLSQLFQALRIEVNDELGALRTLLTSLTSLLAPGGRLVVLTYHSLEDRLVKEWGKGLLGASQSEVDNDPMAAIYGQKKGEIEVVTRKPILPSDEEIAENPRARSAKMRILQRR